MIEFVRDMKMEARIEELKDGGFIDDDYEPVVDKFRELPIAERIEVTRYMLATLTSIMESRGIITEEVKRARTILHNEEGV